MIGNTLKIKVGEHVFETPPLPNFSSMINFGLPIEEQKFNRTVIPECFGDLSSMTNPLVERDDDGNPIWNYEQTQFIIQEYDRRINGCWYLINGKPIYITGDNYFFLNYWWMGAFTSDGYPEFRYAQCKYFYFLDICEKDDNCFGDLFVAQRRFSKTEVAASRVYNKATLNKNVQCFVMSLEYKHARDNIYARIVRSWKVMFEPFRPKHSGTTEPRELLLFGNPPKKSKKSKEEQRKSTVLDSYIQPLPTKVTALQGKRPFFTFVDEAATIDEMNVLDFWSTSKQALALGMKKIIGKISMPCTLEDMKETAGERYYRLWVDSNSKELTPNGRTKSGLKRYLKPYWEGLEGFVDEYGFDKEEEAKSYVEAEIDAAEPAERIKLRRQFPRDENDAFAITFGDAIEEDCKLILQEMLAANKDGMFEAQPCEIYEIGGEVKIKNVKPSSECLWIIEEPHDGVEYIIGIDGTATDKKSSGEKTADAKSEFAIVVTKKVEIGARCYCEVAYVSKVPTRREDMFRMAYHLWIYYNKYGKCKVMAEANASVSSPLDAYFSNRGAKKGLMYEPKYVGTDSREVLNRTGFVKTATMKATLVDLLNIQIRLHGHHFRGRALIENILKVGKENADLADAFQAAMVGWGNFGNVEMKKERARDNYVKMRGTRTFDQATGRWKVETPKLQD